MLLLLCPFMTIFGQQSDEFQPKWRLNISGGLAYMLSGTQDAENTMVDWGFSQSAAKDYYNDIKLGWQGNADVHYMLNTYLGIGVKYSYFKTKNSKTDSYGVSLPTISGYDNYFTADMKESVFVNYIGPSVYAQKFIDNKNKWKMTGLISVGYAHYKNDGSARRAFIRIPDTNSGELYPITTDPYYEVLEACFIGNTVGVTAGAGVEYLINKHLGIGFDISYLGAFYKKLKETNTNQEIDLDKSENVSRLDASLGIRAYF